MMQPRELRIGNWITVMGSIPTQVTAHYLYMMETYTPADPEDEADYKEMTNPVPLTEEWLLKFGFEKHLYDDENPTDGFYLTSEFPIIGCLSTSDTHEYLFDDDTDTLRIKYIHQLQNLHFALTGKELELTPSTV